MEEIIRDNITVHVNDNYLFSITQLGFIKGRSIVFQLLKILNSYTETPDIGGCLDVIYCDFMKAFDKVRHARLIKKLQSYGIKGNILNWDTDLLAQISHRIKVNNIFSNWQEVSHFF